MKKNQNFTPKYWVAHDTRSDDIFVSTLFKYKQDTIDQLSTLYGENWEEDFPYIKIDLIEINLVG